MITLFIDSSRKNLSVALFFDNKMVGLSNVESHFKHSNFLVNEIDKILRNSSININDVNNVVVLNGPGSFTGIRVGVVVAKTISWALNKNIYVLSNLKALAIGVHDDVVISIIHDKDDFSYVGIYHDGTQMEDYLDIDNDVFNLNGRKITICTFDDNDYVKRLKSKLSTNNSVNIKVVEDYDYLNLINYALSTKRVNPHLVSPVYLKKIDAEKKK